jgi:hypothetical protein
MVKTTHSPHTRQEAEADRDRQEGARDTISPRTVPPSDLLPPDRLHFSKFPEGPQIVPPAADLGSNTRAYGEHFIFKPLYLYTLLSISTCKFFVLQSNASLLLKTEKYILEN